MINLAGEAISSRKNSAVHSVLQCHVSLDRLEQSAIDQLMQDAVDGNDPEQIDAPVCIPAVRDETAQRHRALSLHDQSLEKRPARRTSYSSSKLTKQMTTTTTTCTMITTTTKTEKTFVKRKSTASAADHSIERKRFKSASHDSSARDESDTCITALIPSIYKRIYLKCLICSKCQYISAQVTDSNALHTHWLAHGGNVLMNIYDSEVDSILTRVVEFFKASKQPTFEGKIHTVFILNSKEIRRSPTKALPSPDSYIVID